MKSSGFFESYYKCSLSDIFFVLVKSYLILPVRLQRIMKKIFVPRFL